MLAMTYLRYCNVTMARSAEYGSFHQDLGCANDQNLGASAQKFVRCAMKNLLGAPKYI